MNILASSARTARAGKMENISENLSTTFLYTPRTMIRSEQSYSLVKVIAKIFLLCVEFMIQDVYHIALIKEEAF